MENKERNTLTIHLPKELKRDAKRYALDHDRTLTEIVIELLERELGKLPEQKKRQQAGAGH